MATGSPISRAPRKARALILQNTLNRKVEERIDMRSVDDPESPDISPDGRRVAFAALQGGTGRHLHRRSRHQGSHQRHQGRIRRFGTDLVAGRQVADLIARVSQNEKLFRVDLDTGRKTQLTFGRMTMAPPSSSTRTRWSSPRRPLIRAKPDRS
jgi:Tol biopolymer transport system component